MLVEWLWYENRRISVCRVTSYLTCIHILFYINKISVVSTWRSNYNLSFIFFCNLSDSCKFLTDLATSIFWGEYINLFQFGKIIIFSLNLSCFHSLKLQLTHCMMYHFSKTKFLTHEELFLTLFIFVCVSSELVRVIC